MKKIIFKKFNSDVTNFFLISGLSITLIIWTIQAVNFLDIISEDGHGFKVYFQYTFLNYPKIVSKILPFVFFISLFYVITKYEDENQLSIYWNHGINKILFIKNIFYLSIIFMIIQILISLFIVPYSQDKSRSYIRSSGIDFLPNLMKERKFIDTMSNLTIYIDKIDLNNRYTNIILKDQITNSKSQIIYAKKGQLMKENENFYLILNDGEIINLNNDRINKFNFEKTVFNISKFSTKTTTYPKIQERRTASLLKCLMYLDNKIIYPEGFIDMNCDNKSRKPIIRELFKRVISPIYIPIIALLVSILIFRDRHQINYKFFKIKIFIIALFALFASELSMRFIGISTNINYITSLFPFFILFSIYIFIKKKLN